MGVVLHSLREAVREAREATRVHPDGEVLALHERCRVALGYPL